MISQQVRRNQKASLVQVLPFLLLGITVVAAFLIRFLPEPQTVDDAYITFRYARNLSEGFGLVYNPGERVLGATTPLYAFILGIGASLFGSGSLPVQAAVLNSFFGAVSTGLLFFLLRRFGISLPISLGASVLYALSDQSVVFSLGGMETSLFVMLLLGSCLLYFHKKFPAAFFLAALATLTRPDGILLGLLMGADFIIHQRRPWKSYIPSLLSFLIPLLLWTLFATLYYGSPLPHSMAAKQLAYRQDSTFLSRLYEYFLHGPRYLFGFMGLNRWNSPSVLVWAPIIHFILFLAGSFYLFRKNKRAWVLMAFPIFYATGISWKSPFLFQWYILGAAAFFLPVSLVGIEYIVHLIFRLFPQGQKHFILRNIFLSVIVFISLLIQISDFKVSEGNFQVRNFDIEREETYRRVAIELREIIPADSRVALAEIGAFGFYHPAKILDAVGLVSPEALDHYPLNRKFYKWNSTIPASLIAKERPEFIVAYRDFMNFSLLSSPVFQASYRKIKEFPYQLWLSPGPWVYQRIEPEQIQEEINQARRLFHHQEYQQGFESLKKALYYSPKTRQESLDILNEKFLDEMATLSPWDTPFSAHVFIDLEYDQEQGKWLLLDHWGRIFEEDNGQLKAFVQIQLANLDSVSVDLEKGPGGWIIMDNFGRFYEAGKSPESSSFWVEVRKREEIPDTVDFELMPDGRGLYIVNDQGEVIYYGVDQVRSIKSGQWPEATAKDLEISPEGDHFYLLDGLGGVHPNGPAEGSLPRRQTHYWGWDIIRDMEFFPDGTALLLAAGAGSVHVYGPEGKKYETTLPYPDWDYLVDIEFDPETGRIVGMDGNGRIYRDSGNDE